MRLGVTCELPLRAGLPPLGEGLWKGEEYSNVRRGEICGSFYLQGRLDVDVDVDVEDVDPDDKKEMGDDKEEEEA
jgi:hypothetical protein